MERSVEKRQVFDLPERRIEVTEHQATIYVCEQCRGVTRAAFPAAVAAPAQYGERVRAAAVYLNVHQLIPEDRVAEAMNDLFGAVRLCPDSVANWVRGKAAALGRWRRRSLRWRRLRPFVASMKPAFASPERDNGCTPSPPRR